MLLTYIKSVCWLVSGRGLLLSSGWKVKSSSLLVGPNQQQQLRARGGSHLGNLTRRGLRKRERGGRTVAANAQQTNLSSSLSQQEQQAPAGSSSQQEQPDPASNNSQQQQQVPVAAPAACSTC